MRTGPFNQQMLGMEKNKSRKRIIKSTIMMSFLKYQGESEKISLLIFLRQIRNVYKAGKCSQ